MADTTGGLRLVLASGSRSRRQLLEAAGVRCAIVPADINEPAARQRLQAERRDAGARDVAVHLARSKAEAVSRGEPDALVIGGDQVLALGEDIFEKPKDMRGARKHLERLRGRTHWLHCGVALARQGTIVWEHAESAALTMRAFSDRFLEAYLDAASPAICESVGAYQLESAGVQLFEKIEGDYFTILGLPLLALLAELRRRGVLAS